MVDKARATQRIWTAMLLIGALCLPRAHADDHPATDGRAPAAVFVISGGASQGSYQAGQLYVFTEHLKRVAAARARCAPDDSSEVCTYVRAFPQDLVFVGASAGSINAILSMTALLTESAPIDRPEYSLHFRAWVPIGVRRDGASIDVFPEDGDESGVALFSRAQLQGALNEVAQRAPLAPELRWPGSVSLGIVTTRLVPELGTLRDRSVNLIFGFRAPEDLRADAPLAGQGFESLVLVPSYQPGGAADGPGTVRLDGDTAGSLGWTLARVGAEGERTPVLAPTTSSRRDGYAPGVFDLFRASSTIPFVFELDGLDACWVDEHMMINPARVGAAPVVPAAVGSADCEQKAPALMADGGVFDGNPIRAGQFLSLAGALDTTAADGPRLLDSEPARIGGQGWRKPTYYFFDPDLGDSREQEQAARSSYEFERLMGFLRTAPGAARMQELTTFKLENPDADIRVVGPAAGRDQTFSGYAGAFLGFFDRSLRAWDFYVGMHDALAFLGSGRAMPAIYAADGEAAVRGIPVGVVPQALLPAVRTDESTREDDTLFEIVERLLAVDVLPEDCPAGSTRPFCQDLERLRVRAGDDRILALTVDTHLGRPLDAPPDPDQLRWCEGAHDSADVCVGYDPAAMAANLRRLGWLSVQRRIEAVASEEPYSVDWITEELSARLYAHDAPGLDAPLAVFTGWDLGEDYAPDLTPDERCVEARLAGSDEATERCAAENLDRGPAQGEIGALRIPRFAVYARSRLSWEMAALHGRRGRTGILRLQPEPTAGPSLLTWYAREQFTGDGPLWFAGYQSAGGQYGADGVLLGYMHYLDRAFQPYRGLYAGADLGLQLPTVVEGPVLLTAHAGLAPLRALQRPRLLGTGYPILSPELGLFLRAYPTAFVGRLLEPADTTADGADAEAVDPTRAGGDVFQEGLRVFTRLDEDGLAYWAWGPELRLNVAGLLSASVNVPIFPDMTLQKFVVTNRFTATLTLPFGSRRARPPHWEGDR